MSQEIYYTSAPRGLKPGSRGFCTVVSTQGMAKNLAEQLESLSGYKHLFAPQDAQAKLNPVAYSHLVITVGGRRYHILSRICDAGLDYTQRTNKFAHHIALDTNELPASGPAAVLLAPGFMTRAYTGEPQVRPSGPVPPSSSVLVGVCQGWQQITGDAGWGGVLAETALDPNGQAVIIYRPGIDVMQLLSESLALVPPELRWQVTFSTYFSKLPPGIDCRWRCVLEGTPEAAMVRAQQTRTINLCAPLPKANGVHVEAGRNGTMIPLPARYSNTPQVHAVRVSDEELEAMLRSEQREDKAQFSAPPSRSAAPVNTLSLAPQPDCVLGLPSDQVSQSSGANKRRKSPQVAIATVVILLLVVSCAAGIWLYLPHGASDIETSSQPVAAQVKQNFTGTPQKKIDAQEKKNLDLTGEDKNPIEKKRNDQSDISDTNVKSTSTADKPNTPAVPPSVTAAELQPPIGTRANSATAQPPGEPKVNSDTAQADNKPRAPTVVRLSKELPEKSDTEPRDIVENIDSCTSIELVGADRIKSLIDLRLSPDSGTWKLEQFDKAGSQTVATFSFRDSKLIFAWKKKAGGIQNIELLENNIVVVRNKNGVTIVPLRPLKEAEPLEFKKGATGLLYSQVPLQLRAWSSRYNSEFTLLAGDGFVEEAVVQPGKSGDAFCELVIVRRTFVGQEDHAASGIVAKRLAIILRFDPATAQVRADLAVNLIGWVNPISIDKYPQAFKGSVYRHISADSLHSEVTNNYLKSEIEKHENNKNKLESDQSKKEDAIKNQINQLIRDIEALNGESKHSYWVYQRMKAIESSRSRKLGYQLSVEFKELGERVIVASTARKD